MEERFNCICGADIQLRNLNNHFTTKKHIAFLLNYGKLINDYKHLSKKEVKRKILKKDMSYREPTDIKLPITLTWD